MVEQRLGGRYTQQADDSPGGRIHWGLRRRPRQVDGAWNPGSSDRQEPRGGVLQAKVFQSDYGESVMIILYSKCSFLSSSSLLQGCHRANKTQKYVPNLGPGQQARKGLCAGTWSTVFWCLGSATEVWGRDLRFSKASQPLAGCGRLGRTTAFQSGTGSQGELDISVP